jgi:AhpD family alkylhydroperoxidase
MYTKDKLARLSKLAELSPEATEAFRAWDKLALQDGAIPKKYKELMAIGVALTTQCPYRIDLYRQAALKAGAKRAGVDGGDPRRRRAARGRCDHAWHAPAGRLKPRGAKHTARSGCDLRRWLITAGGTCRR